MTEKKPYIENKCSVRIISPKTERRCFFGYYDLKAYDDSDRYHLCNIVEFENRFPTSSDVMELGVIDLDNGSYEKIDETTAWNFQQGAMLQWSRAEKDVIYFNTFKDGEYLTIKKNVRTGEKSYAPVCANISRDGKYGLKINFSRIFDFRPGYGYCNIKDPYFDVAQPENDGVFLVDLEKGIEKLILSYPDMVKLLNMPEVEKSKFVVNHITFNLSGDKFLLLLRNFPEEGSDAYGTALIVSDINGNARLIGGFEGGFSHYDWKSDNEVLFFARYKGVYDMYLINVDTIEWTLLYPTIFNGRNLHCLYSPDRRYMIGDTYAGKDGYRPLFFYDCKTKESDILTKSLVPYGNGFDDLRTDLHNRFNTKGDKISFDTIQNGKREIAELDFAEYIKKRG